MRQIEFAGPKAAKGRLGRPLRRLLAARPYRLTRNPVYLLYVAVALAEALFALAHLYVVRVEEPRLLERFGAAYARRVPRWLPRRTR